jgi:hypothetical protein
MIPAGEKGTGFKPLDEKISNRAWLGMLALQGSNPASPTEFTNDVDDV